MKRYQSGVSLLEVLISIGVMALLSVTLATVMNDSVRDVKEQNAAQYQKTVMMAASSWVKDNYSTVKTAATAAAPHKLTIATLVADNYLPAGFLSVNPFNQSTCILTLEPVADKLETVVVTEGGVEISQGRIPTVANLVGATGGFIMPDGVTAQGSFGAWSKNIATYTADNCSGTAATKNHLAGVLFLDGNNLLNDYVSRSAVPGHPEANTMTAPLLISYIVAEGDVCATTGSIGSSSGGTLLTCQGGTYQTQGTGAGSVYWKDPVASYAALPACNASSIWQTRIVQAPTVGTGPRAYTCDSVTWKALAVDNSGNLTVAGTATIGTLGVTGNATVTGTTTTGTLAVTNNATVGGNTTITGTAQILTIVAEGGACTTTGIIATTGGGALLTCQGGTYKMQGAAYWRDPVASYAALPACNASSIWQTRIVQTPTVGTGPRAYTCDSVTWKALAVDNSGNLTVAGTATIGTLGVTGNATVGGNATVTGTTTTNTLAVTNTAAVGGNTTIGGSLLITYIVAEGGACTTTGSIGTSAAGALLTCQGGTYKMQGAAYWKDPVASYAALPACNASSAWQTRIVQAPTVGTGPRAYTCDSVTWKALAVDNSGNLTVAGTATIGTLGVLGNATVGGNATVTGATTTGTLAVTSNATVGGNATVTGTTTTGTLAVTGNSTVGGNNTVTGNLTVNGNTALGNATTDTVTIPGNASINQLSGNLQITTIAVLGGACSPNGKIAADATGAIVSCKSAVWTIPSSAPLSFDLTHKVMGDRTVPDTLTCYLAAVQSKYVFYFHRYDTAPIAFVRYVDLSGTRSVDFQYPSRLYWRSVDAGDCAGFSLGFLISTLKATGYE